MSANRKLTDAIDRNLRKVSEGVTLFDEIWNKFYAASTSAHREKFEGELKKEIKKLQRLREEIKKWLGSSEVKDKRQLLDARKLIESKMESFKICEREAKTKAYSKEGLSQQPKLDPLIQAKEVTRQWVNESLMHLKQKAEELECDLESQQTRKRRSNFDTTVEDHLKMHMSHISNLELVLRLLENDEISPDDVNDIREDVEYFVDNYSDPDYVDNEYLYDDVIGDRGQDETLLVKAEVPKIPNEAPSPVPPKVEPTTPVVEKERERKPKVQEVKKPVKLEEKKQTVQTVPKKSRPVSAPRPVAQPLAVQTGKTFQEAIVGSQSAQSKTTSVNNPGGISVVVQSNVIPEVDAERDDTLSFSQPDSGMLDSTTPTQSSTEFPPVEDSVQVDAEVSASDIRPQENVFAPPSSVNIGQIGSPALRSVSPADSNLHDVDYMEMLEISLQSMPQEYDADRPQKYVPRNPYQVPESFPRQPLQQFDDPSVFERFDVDTLFFVFYFQQDTYQQYLAAKELKRQSWRFHKKYLTWFQRHSEPKIATDEFEQGTYVYFDYETGWCQRIKSEFTFEYQFLEDELA